MRFKDKVVFITGGSKGLGKALTLKFLEEGAEVGVVGRDGNSLEKLVRESGGNSGLAVYEGDISDYKRMEEIVDDFVGRKKRVDILVNNAGIVNALLPAERLKKEDFDRTIDVNLKGTFYVTQLFGKKMIEQGGGRIINVSSQAGLFGEKGFLPYALSKGAIILMTRMLAHEWGKYGVTLCSVAPGFVKGGMNENLIKKDIFVQFLSKRNPLLRMAEVSEFVSLILFLSSEDARYINGETIVLDGGMTGYTMEPLLDFIASLKKEK
jgi:NAD(P)-dependent dehydrogenase (short-subunit alcohol dehydrogenase family)